MARNPDAPVSGVTAALSAIDQAAKVASSLTSKVGGRKVSKDDLATIQREIEAIEASLLQAKEMILDLREKLIEAEDENVTLRKEISSADIKVSTEDSRALEREQYERKKVGQSWVTVRKGEDEPYYCSTCFAQGQIIPVQPMGSLFASTATHNCPGCGTTFLLD
ncbi:MAG: hypothetical protein GY719_27695 [bacterium]|nr:hypothetical protein [bacterium]